MLMYDEFQAAANAYRRYAPHDIPPVSEGHRMSDFDEIAKSERAGLYSETVVT